MQHNLHLTEVIVHLSYASPGDLRNYLGYLITMVVSFAHLGGNYV